MKVTLKFDSHEDRQELARCMKADNAYKALWDLQEELRRVNKYSEDKNEVLYSGHWRMILIEILENNNINFDEEYT